MNFFINISVGKACRFFLVISLIICDKGPVHLMIFILIYLSIVKAYQL